MAMLSRDPQADSIEPKTSPTPATRTSGNAARVTVNRRRAMRGIVTATTPTSGPRPRPSDRDQAGRLAGRDETDAEDQGRADREDRRAAGLGIGRLAGEPGPDRVGLGWRGSVQRVGRDVDAADRNLRPGGLKRGEHDAHGDDDQHHAGGQPDRVAKSDRDDRRDRTLGGDDRRDDGHLADGQRRIGQVQPGRVADPGQQQEGERGRRDVARARG